MKHYKDSVDYLSKRPWIRPVDVCVAFEEPHERNEVILAGGLRYRITRQLTRSEFLDQVRKNLQQKNAVAAQGKLKNSRIDVGSAVDVSEPGPQFTHFYLAECI